MTMPRLSFPTWLRRAAQMAIGIGLLAFLWHAADGPDAARILAQADPFWLIAATFALTVQTALSALRWRLTARQLGIALTPRHALREYYLAQVVNQSLPGGMVGDAGRAVRSRDQAGLTAAGLAVVFERLAGQVVIFVAMSVSFLATLAVPGGIDWPRPLVIPVLALIAVGALSPLLLLAAVFLPGRAGRTARGFSLHLATALLAPQVLSLQLLLSIGTAAANLTAFAFCAMAVGAQLPLVAVFTLVPLILFTMLLPISIGGWGVREGAAAALFPLAGASASQGLATSVAFGLVFAVSVLPGLAVLWHRPRTRAALP